MASLPFRVALACGWLPAATEGPGGEFVDQHLLTRHREKDLVGVIEAHPELLGFGIDKSTAIVVQGNRFKVVGISKVAIYDGREPDGNNYFFLSPGDTYDLRKK